MATTFAAVNDAARIASHALPDTQGVVEDQTPTTPKPSFARLPSAPPPPPPTSSSSTSAHELPTATTPTRRNFPGADGKRSILADYSVQPPMTPATPETSLKREGSHRSRGTMEDVEMGDTDSQAGDEDASDNDSTTSDSKRPLKKKKGQRFFCTEFPPCSLSFTRSEHLARHIRKHTGERPFQCHCSRRFSRLDNLRQHAQTVHVNEEIPGDSLAATSTRFQRQIRTDRVRPPTSRSRASTLGSQAGHSRGHSRNLSTSSIASNASSIVFPDDARRRPQPLAMASDHMIPPRLSLNTYDNSITSPGQSYAYYSQSPSGYSTPTSTTFSTGPGSPQLSSPSVNLARSSFFNGSRHARRLSVPSGPPPFHPQSSGGFPPPYFTPIHSGTSSTFSQSGTMYGGSPTSSVYSHRRGDSESDIELRRRTWHPSTYSNYLQRPATSGLSYHQTPDDHRPESSRQLAASQVTRLPGIESFDHVAPVSARQQHSPMMADVRPSSSGRPSTDHGLHQGLTRLDIAAANTQQDGGWSVGPPPTAVQTGYFPQGPHHHHSASMPEPALRNSKRQAWYGGPVQRPGHPVAANSPQRPSPEDSGSSDGVPTPAASQGTEYHPVIVNPAGGPVDLYHPPQPVPSSVAEEPTHKSSYYATHPPGQHHILHAPPSAPAQPPPAPSQPTYTLQTGHDLHYPQHQFVFPPPSSQQNNSFRFPAPAEHRQPEPHPMSRTDHDMDRLEALVAVATSEGRAAAVMEKGTA